MDLQEVFEYNDNDKGKKPKSNQSNLSLKDILGMEKDSSIPFSSFEYKNNLENGLKMGSEDPYKVSQEEEANSQSFSKQLALTTGNTVSNILSGTVGGLGYLSTLFEDSKGDYSNAVTDWVDSVRNPFGELKRKNNETIDLTDSAFWLNSGQSLVESAIQFGLIAESGGLLASSAVSKLGSLLKLGNTANKVIKGSVQAMTAVELSYLEGAMSGATVYRDIYKNQFDKLTKKGLSIEEADKLAKQYASDGASTTVQLNTTIGSALNLTGIGSVFNKSANQAEKYFLTGAGKRLVGESVKDYTERIIKQSPDYLNELTKQNYGKLLSEMSQEGIEEVVTQLAENTGRISGEQGKDLSYLEQFQSAYNNLNSVVNNEGVLNFALGAIGGISQTLLLDNVIPSQQINTLSEEGSLIPIKNEDNTIKVDSKGNPIYKIQRISPRARDIYDNQQYYNNIKDSLFSDLSYIDDLQNKLANTTDKVEQKEIYRKLYSIGTLDSIYKGMGENLISSYQKILEQDNNTDLSEAPLQEAEQLQNQINNIKSATNEKGELSEEQKNQLLELDKILKQKQKEAIDLKDTTIAMQLGLSKNKDDNDYKIRATKAINQIKQVDNFYKKNKDKYILPEEVNVNFAEYITKLQSDIIERQNIQQDLENDLLTEKTNFQLFFSIEEYGDIENMLLNSSLSSLIKENDKLNKAIKEYDKINDINILKDFVDTTDKKVYSNDDILDNLNKKIENNNKLIEEKENEVSESIKNSPSFQKSKAKNIDDYVSKWIKKYPDFQNLMSFKESLNEFTRNTESIKNKLNDVTSSKGRARFINNHNQRIKDLKEQIEAQHNIYSYEEARKANEDNYYIDKIEKLNKEQEKKINNEVKKLENEIKQLENIDLKTNKKKSFYSSLINYFNRLSDINTLVKLRKNRLQELQEYLKKINEIKEESKVEIIKEKETPLEKQEVITKVKEDIEKIEFPSDTEFIKLGSLSDDGLVEEIPQGEGSEDDDLINQQIYASIQKEYENEKEDKKEKIEEKENDKIIISLKIQKLQDKIREVFKSKDNKDDKIVNFVFNFIKEAIDAGEYNINYLSESLIKYINKNIKTLSPDEVYKLQLKLYSFSDDVVDLMYDNKKLIKELKTSFTKFKNFIDNNYELNLNKENNKEENKVKEEEIQEELTPDEIQNIVNNEEDNIINYNDPFTLDMYRFQYGQIRDDNSLTKDALEVVKLKNSLPIEIRIDKNYKSDSKELPLAIYLVGSEKPIGYLPTIEFIETTYIKDLSNNYKSYNLETKNQKIAQELYDVLNQINYLKLDKDLIITQEGSNELIVNYKEYNKQKIQKIRDLFNKDNNLILESNILRKSGGRPITQKNRKNLEGVIDNNDNRVKVHTVIKNTLFPSIEGEVKNELNSKVLAVLSYPDINNNINTYPLAIKTLDKNKINTLKELFTLYYKANKGESDSINNLISIGVQLGLSYDIVNNFDKFIQQYFTTVNYINDINERRNKKIPSLIFMKDSNGKKNVNLFAIKASNSNTSYNLDDKGFNKFIDNLETEFSNKLFTLDNEFLNNGQNKGFKYPILEQGKIVVKGGKSTTYYDYIKDMLETNFDVNKDNFIINEKGEKQLIYTKDFVINFNYNYKIKKEVNEPTKIIEVEDDSDDALDSVFSINDEYIKKPEVKEGVDFVFEKNSELFNIGSKEEYSEYLKTIFPDSKVQDIVYHGSSEINLEKFNLKDFTRTSLTDFIGKKAAYFSNQKAVASTYVGNKEYGKKRIWKSLLNVLEGFNDEDGNEIFPPTSSKEILNKIGTSTKEKEYPIDLRDGKLEDSFGYAAEIGLFLPSKEDTIKYLNFLEKEDIKGIKKELSKYSNKEGNIYGALLNSQNPFKINSLTGSIAVLDIKGNTSFEKNQKLKEELNKHDSLIVSNVSDSAIDYRSLKYNIPYDTSILEKTYAVFEPEQIHILGSNEDIEQFKKWVKQNRKYSSSFLESFKNSNEEYKKFTYDFININVILNDELNQESKNKYLEEASKVQSMKDANKLFNKICKE